MTRAQPKRKKAKDAKLEELLRAVEAQWGKAALTGGSDSHYKVRCPGGGMVSTSGSASDHRTWLNFRSRLRQNGLNV